MNTLYNFSALEDNLKGVGEYGSGMAVEEKLVPHLFPSYFLPTAILKLFSAIFSWADFFFQNPIFFENRITTSHILGLVWRSRLGTLFKRHRGITAISLILITLNHILLVLVIATKLYFILNSFLLVKVLIPCHTSACATAISVYKTWTYPSTYTTICISGKGQVH